MLIRASFTRFLVPFLRVSSLRLSVPLLPLFMLGVILFGAVLREPPKHRSRPHYLHGGLANARPEMETPLNPASQYLMFDRGKLGLQMELPDPLGTESWTPPIVVRKSSAQEKIALPENRTRWRYLTLERRREIREALQGNQEHAWRRLAVHHSASLTGNARLLLADHQRRWPGLEDGAYHFVIGNGSYSADGEVEFGSRWHEQRPSAAMRVEELNATSLSVCLIGSFLREAPSTAQWQALDELLTYLRAQLGPLELSAHRDVESTAQSCPGPAITNAHLDQLGRGF